MYSVSTGISFGKEFGLPLEAETRSELCYRLGGGKTVVCEGIFDEHNPIAIKTIGMLWVGEFVASRNGDGVLYSTDDMLAMQHPVNLGTKDPLAPLQKRLKIFANEELIVPIGGRRLRRFRVPLLESAKVKFIEVGRSRIVTPGEAYPADYF